MNSERLKIRHYIGYLHANELTGSIDVIIQSLNDAKTKSERDFQDIIIEFDADEHSFDVIGHTEETEEAFQKRMETEKERMETQRKLTYKTRLQKELQDFDLYQQLKKRFEPA